MDSAWLPPHHPHGRHIDVTSMRALRHGVQPRRPHRCMHRCARAPLVSHPVYIDGARLHRRGHRCARAPLFSDAVHIHVDIDVYARRCSTAPPTSMFTRAVVQQRRHRCVRALLFSHVVHIASITVHIDVRSCCVWFFTFFFLKTYTVFARKV